MTIQTTARLPRWPRLARLLRQARRIDLWSFLAIVLALVVVVSVARGRLLRTTTTPDPIIVLPTPALPIAPPVMAVQTAPGAQRTTRAVIAYDTIGQPIGAIEPGRAYTPTAQLDERWIEADVAGSGIVRLKIAELFGVAALPPAVRAPASAPLVVPDQAAPISEPAAAPEQAPAPIEIAPPPAIAPIAEPAVEPAPEPTWGPGSRSGGSWGPPPPTWGPGTSSGGSW